MHPVIESRPEFVAFQKRRAKIDKDAAEGEAATLQAHANYQQVLERTKPGNPLPDPPTSNVHTVRRHREHLVTTLRADQAAFLAEHADELLGLLAGREDDVIAEARNLIAALDALDLEWRELHSSANEVHRSAGGRGPLTSSCGPEGLAPLVLAARTDTRVTREPFLHHVDSIGMRTYESPAEMLMAAGPR